MSRKKSADEPLKKPTPPTRTILDREERARQSLRRLGVGDVEASRLIVRPIERVYRALIDLWRESGQQPTSDEIYERARLSADGIKPDSLITGMMPRLIREGLVDSPRKGVYIPVVKEE